MKKKEIEKEKLADPLIAIASAICNLAKES